MSKSTQRNLVNSGPLGTLRRAARRAGELLYLKRELVVFAGDMRDEDWFREGRQPPQHKPLIDVEIREATREDLDKFAAIVGHRRLKRFDDWFRAGHRAFVALKDGSIVYFQWLAFKDFHHPWLDYEFTVAGDEVLPIDLYTMPDYRMKNIHLAVNSLTFSLCRQLERYRLLATTAPEHFALFRLMYRKNGFGHARALRKITYHRVVGIKHHAVRQLTADGLALQQADSA